MRITQLLTFGLISCLLAAPSARAQVTEIVIPAGAFAKDFEGKVEESGGVAGTGMQHGTYKFPTGKGSALSGVTTLVPAAWIGEDIDVYFGGSTGGAYSGQFRLIGKFYYNVINITTSLSAEDNGTTEVLIVDDYEVVERRFAIAVGRDPDHVGDLEDGVMMNFEYLRIVCVTC